MGSLIAREDVIVVRLGDGLDDNVERRLGIAILSKSVVLGFSISNGVANSAAGAIGLAGLVFGGTGTVGTIVGQGDIMSGLGGIFTGGVGCLAGSGLGFQDGMELGNGVGIADGLESADGRSDGFGVRSVAGVRSGDGGGNGGGIEIFTVDVIDGGQIDVVVVGSFGGDGLKSVGCSDEARVGDDACFGFGDDDRIFDGVGFGTKTVVGVGVGAEAVALLGDGGFDEGIHISSVDVIEVGEVGGIMVGSFAGKSMVGNGVGVEVGLGLWNGDITCTRPEVGTEVEGSLS